VIPSRGSARAAVACLQDGVGEPEVMLSGVDVAAAQAALCHGSGKDTLTTLSWGNPEDPELRAARWRFAQQGARTRFRAGRSAERGWGGTRLQHNAQRVLVLLDLGPE
jgi:hypothetical protein